MDEFIYSLQTSYKKKEIDNSLTKALHYSPNPNKVESSSEGISKLYNVLSAKKAMSSNTVKLGN